MQPDRERSLMDELWLARADHLAAVRRGCGVVIVRDGRKLAESSARSVARALREAASEAGRSVRGAILYLALGTAELDRGELTLLREIGLDRVLLGASPLNGPHARALARGLQPVPALVAIT